MRYLIVLAAILTLSVAAWAQKVTIRAVNQPAAAVFRSIMEQTGKNFVYSSELLNDMRVSVRVSNKPLDKALKEIFKGTDIEYKIKGKTVVLKKKPRKSRKSDIMTQTTPPAAVTPAKVSDTIIMLDEVVVLSRLEDSEVQTPEIGAIQLTAAQVRNTPTLLGEADVVKTLHTEPGVTEGTEGMAGMNVHGGNTDENLYMLDNVPLYQVNHFAGLFSAFNPEIIRYIDFFKSSVPAKYDGRLSSFLDVRLQNGNAQGHHGSARLGLTAGSFNILGPIGSKTSYLFGLRRSWFDVLTVPFLAVLNSSVEDKIRFCYYFMDLNAQVTHRFSSRATGFVSLYFGDDLLKTGTKDAGFDGDIIGSVENYKYDYHWGNLVARTGLNYRLSESMSAEFTAAYTRYFSDMHSHEIYKNSDPNNVFISESFIKTNNNINDWIFRGDFDWQPTVRTRVRFGGNYVRHSFLPARTSHLYIVGNTQRESTDPTWAYRANEFNAYIEDDWEPTRKLRFNAGVHASLFYIDSSLKHGLSPRLSVSYRPTESVALKAAYSHTTQYVHQLSQSYLALPTDQWIPVTGKFKPQTADKIAAGMYWQSPNATYAASAEAYYKWMHHLVEYRDEYYLRPPLEMWNERLTSGDGTAKGIDLKVEKKSGRITGHLSYSLAWADRTFAEKNGGHTYPARFDNRHTINLLVNWKVSDKVQLNASWTGHSGNRYTFMPYMWESPDINDTGAPYTDDAPLQTSLNNYRLPFYHRLDLSCTVQNSRGYWTFSLYNAYNHLNTIAIRRGTRDVVVSTPDEYYVTERPVFQKVKLLPIIPSISYTWKF